MIFCFTVSLDEARIALLSLRESFIINFPSRERTISKTYLLVFHHEFRTSQFISPLEKFCNQPEDCVFAMRYEMQILSQAGFLIELSHNLLHVLRSRSIKSGGGGGLNFLFADSDTQAVREADFAGKYRFYFQSAMKLSRTRAKFVRTNDDFEVCALKRSAMLCDA